MSSAIDGAVTKPTVAQLWCVLALLASGALSTFTVIWQVRLAIADAHRTSNATREPLELELDCDWTYLDRPLGIGLSAKQSPGEERSGFIHDTKSALDLTLEAFSTP